MREHIAALPHRSLIGLFALIVAVLLFAGTAVVSTVRARSDEQSSSRSNAKHVLTVYDSGVERGILTNKDNLGEALKEAGFDLSKNDITEPGLDEELVSGTYDVNIYRARAVMVIDGTARTKIMSPHHTPEQVAKQAKVDVQPEDELRLEHSGDIVSDGALERLVIKRSTPFTFVFYGKKIEAYTMQKTVGDMLVDKDITLGENDKLSVPKSTAITAGMTVELWRNGLQTVTVDEKVDFPVERIEDANREVGYRDIKTPGVKGDRTVTYEINVKNGKEVSRKEIKSVVTKQPEKQVEIVGAKPSFDGDVAAAFASLRACESGGNYANKNNPTYRGAYQFGYVTWANNGGYYDPADAPPALQDAAAYALYQRRGWQPWPHCGSNLPDIYR